MSDTLPTQGNVGNGWWTEIFNSDSTASLTLSVPSGRSLNGALNGSLVLLPGKSTAITADPNGNFWITVPPLPSVFSGQAIYVNSNATIVPGVYDVDTSAGTVTLTDDSGRSRPPFRFDVARHSGMMPPTVPG